MLAILQSPAFAVLMELMLGTTSIAKSYQVGTIRAVPVPHGPLDGLGSLAMAAHDLKRIADCSNEVSHVFSLPSLLCGRELEQELTPLAEAAARSELDVEKRFEGVQASINEAVWNLYGLRGRERQSLMTSAYRIPDDAETPLAGPEEDDDAEARSSAQSITERVENLVQWAVGVVVGRWDVRLALDPTLLPKLQDAFDPLPVCSPGTLVGPDGLPATRDSIASKEWLRARPNVITSPPDGTVKGPAITQAEYPFQVDWDGILVDDEGHSDDIVRRVEDVLALVYGECAPGIEQESCAALGVKSLREYFRKRFYDFHIQRYSRSRRKAPIYWYLTTRRKSYGLWLYYHRLTRDTLYVAVQSYIEPKIVHTRSQIAELKARRAALSDETGAGERRRFDKELDRLAGLEAELVEFGEALQRVTAMGYEPDLNDGVILNIAPLHQLVPWKEAEKMWKELVSGKYEWSSMSKRLRARRVI
jgi:hypothetical protein